MIKQTYLLICILMALCITACQDYTDDGTISSVIDGDMVEVTIKTGMPALTIQTRANGTQSTSNERKLGQMDILVFEVEGEGDQKTEKFAYRTQNTNDLSSIDFETSNEIEITAKLQVSQNDEKYQIVFLANLAEEVQSVFGDNNENRKDELKKDLLEEIIFKQKKEWLTGEEEFLPMWGEATNVVTIDKNINSTAFGELNLLRSVARIQLGVTISGYDLDGGANFFEIKSVRVYNVNEDGHAVPNPANLENNIAKQPTLVESTSIFETKTENKDIKYVVQPTDENKVPGIYVNEASNQNASEATFLIIEAIYKKENPSNTPTFYKVGFYDDENNPTDILRNVNYNMFITGVTGPGEETEEEAKESTTSNLTVAMTEWSNGEYKYVVFSGQYYLAVSEKTFEVPKQAAQYKLDVITNYPDGWKAEITGGTPWLKDLSQDASTKIEESEEITFEVERNETQSIREDGKITFTCGNDHLSLDVLVVQSTEIEYTLIIEIDDDDNLIGSYVDFNKTITFTSGYYDLYKEEEHKIKPRTLRVTWTPADEDLIVDYNRYFDWGDETDIKTSYSTEDPEAEYGTAIITVKPNRLEERNDFFPEIVGDIQFQVGDEGNTRQNVLIRRRHHEVYIEKADRYVVKSGEKYSFTLFANTDWKIRSPFNLAGQEWLGDLVDFNIEDTEGGSTLQTTMENSGKEIEFTFKDEVSGNISMDVAIRVEFEDLGQTISKEYTFHIYKDETSDNEPRFAEAANCYVLQTNGRGVSIPLSQANRSPLNEVKVGSSVVSNHIKVNNILNWKYVWTDYPYGLGENHSPVKSVVIDDADKGPDARLIVTPGGNPGNVVVAITNEQGEIHWSWHIWVVNDNFDPYGTNTDDWYSFRYYQFMDRNLGALTDDPEKPESRGLYYQWGRKDPFPAAVGNKDNMILGLRYNGDSQQTQIEWKPKVMDWSAMNNLGDHALGASVREPENMFCPVSTTNWFSHTWEYNNKLVMYDFWNNAVGVDISQSQKGIFDPCPEGWKTVPGSVAGNQDWYTVFKYVPYDVVNNYSNLYIEGKGNLGKWPHTGYIEGTNGTLMNTDAGHYWTGSPNSPSPYEGLKIELQPFPVRAESETNPSLTLNMRAALPVRCMRRVDKIQ